MKAIVSVIGHDKMGIIAKVSNALAEIEVNIEDISQTIMQDYFAMIMLVDISKTTSNLEEIADILDSVGAKIGVKIQLQHQDIFNAMHKL